MKASHTLTANSYMAFSLLFIGFFLQLEPQRVHHFQTSTMVEALMDSNSLGFLVWNPSNIALRKKMADGNSSWWVPLMCPRGRL